jgi:hypothetical protein
MLPAAQQFAPPLQTAWSPQHCWPLMQTCPAAQQVLLAHCCATLQQRPKKQVWVLEQHCWPLRSRRWPSGGQGG